MAAGDDKIDHMPDEKKLFFSASSDDSTAASMGSSREVLGGQIGPYKLLSVLGEGGFGIVYLAEQQEPIRRQVALKVIKPGMDTKQVIARFEAERQTLASFDHPNIAHVFDAGATDAGRPYFVMEYVKGFPITEYCDRSKLCTEERLRLFIPLCQAIQHAHQKGIIHRDIKPTNILVFSQDNQAVSKVIDFGIARAIGQPLTGKTLFTTRGQLIGTPEYMSPEQVDMVSRDIDTRSDVYSLGAVLYELLVGVPPFETESLRESGIESMRKTIREQDPLRPSTRLSSLGKDADKIAERRGSESTVLARRLRQELEWIPLKAIRKERAHRYQSASELADDVRNYLNGAPLIAGPESAAYRLKKLFRRHKPLVAATAAIVATLIVGLAVSTAMYFRAEKSRATTERARTEEATQRGIAETERDRATEAERQTQRMLVDSYEQQARKYIETGDLDEALLLLSEAYKLDQRLSLRLLLSQCLRQHPNSAFRKADGFAPWSLDPTAIRQASFSVSPCRRFIAIVDDDRESIHVFNTSTGRSIMECICKHVTCLTFTPDGCYMLAGIGRPDDSSALRIWDLSQGRETLSFERGIADFDAVYEVEPSALPAREDLERLYRALYISPRGEWIAFVDLIRSEGTLQSTARSWDPKLKQLHMTPPGHFNSLITEMCLKATPAWERDPSGSDVPYELVTIEGRHMLHIWSLPNLEFSQKFPWTLRFAAFGPHGKVMIDFTEEHGGRLMDRRYNTILRAFPDARYAGFSPSGKRFVILEASGSSSGNGEESVSAALCDSRNGGHIANLTGTEPKNWHFTPNSELLVTEHADGQINVWHAQDGQLAFSIPGEVGQQVTDISHDSIWLVTFSPAQQQAIKLWNLISGECFEPYGDDTLGKDLGADWLPTNTLPANTDRIFAYSYKPPRSLPRFNGDGSALIAGSGLRHLTGGTETAGELKALVEKHIPFRLQNGRLRPASTGEMLQAKLDYDMLSKGVRAVQTVDSTLDLILHKIQVGKLEDASHPMSKVQSLLPLRDANLSQRVEEVLKKLSEAYYVRANMRDRHGDYTDAVRDYQTSLSSDANNHEILNSLAWLQSTCPNLEMRDLQAALRNAKKACELTKWKHWRYLSTLAIAYAQNGGFEEAIDYQKRALNLLPDDEQDRWKVNFELRLSLFESHRSYDRNLFLHVPTENLIGWWRFDDAGGRIAMDASGNGHHGQVVGDPKWQPGKVGTCLRLKGEDHVNCGCYSSLNITDAITLAFWIRIEKLDEGTDFCTIVGKGDNSWRMRSSRWNYLTFDCFGLDTGDASFNSVKSAKGVNDYHWHYISGVYDGRRLLLYVDGKLDSSVNAQGTISSNNESNLLIGGSWDGLIDDVRIYNRALNADEISELYDSTK